MPDTHFVNLEDGRRLADALQLGVFSRSCWLEAGDLWQARPPGEPGVLPQNELPLSALSSIIGFACSSGGF